jgi:hypothetical protein
VFFIDDDQAEIRKRQEQRRTRALGLARSGDALQQRGAIAAGRDCPAQLGGRRRLGQIMPDPVTPASR